MRIEADILAWFYAKGKSYQSRVSDILRLKMLESVKALVNNADETQMSKLGEEFIESMAEALAHAKGERPGYRMHRIKVTPNEVRRARERIGLSHDCFAAAIGVSAATLRKWKQGQRQPTAAAKTLLKVIEREPKAVMRALQGT